VVIVRAGAELLVVDEGAVVASLVVGAVAAVAPEA
jgi:hypothetical protein